MLASAFSRSWFRTSAFIGKTIPRPIEGGDRVEFGIDLAELAAQALDVAVDRAVVDINIVLIGGVHRSEEHTSELQSLMRISYAVFCLQKKIPNNLKSEPNITYDNTL